MTLKGSNISVVVEGAWGGSEVEVGGSERVEEIEYRKIIGGEVSAGWPSHAVAWSPACLHGVKDSLICFIVYLHDALAGVKVKRM